MEKYLLAILGVVAFTCFIMLFIFVNISKNKKTKARFPNRIFYKLFYTDEKSDKKLENIIYSKLLVSDKYQLQGKPDYVFINNTKSRLIPIELKSGEIKDEEKPHYGDFLQLVAYFLILEDVFKIKVKYGYLIYKDYMFKIQNNKNNKKLLLKVINDMNYLVKTGKADGNLVDPSFVKCRYCVCKNTVCEFCDIK